MRLNDIEINNAIYNIRKILGDKSLAVELEMIIKHLPTYNKIIKVHISQLKQVLALDNHQNKDIEKINLSSTVKQLINIFDKLEENDLQQLEELHIVASSWQKEKSNIANQNIVSEATL